jgi:hypothetical protein
MDILAWTDCVRSSAGKISYIDIFSNSNLQKIFANNAALVVADFQGLIAEDGQLYIMDPQGVDSNEKGHSDQLNAF